MEIFFDVDGVLINGFHTKPERRMRWDKDLDKDLGIPQDHFDEIFKGWFLEVLQGRLDFEEEMERWLKRNGYDVEARRVINYWHEKDSQVNPLVIGVVQKLSTIDGVNLYTATNQSHARIAYLRDTLGWGQYFKDFYYSARFRCLKHDARYFAQIEEDLGLAPYTNEILYFDDDPKNIAVASSRGWKAVLFDTDDDLVSHPTIQKLLSIRS